MSDANTEALAEALVRGADSWREACEAVERKELIAYNFKDCEIKDIDVVETTFSGCTFDLVKISNITFSGCIFRDCTFIRSRIKACDLQSCELNSTETQKCTLSQIRILESKIIETKFVGGIFEHVLIRESSLEKSSYLGNSVESMEFYRCKGHCLEFSEATIGCISITQSVIEKAEIVNTNTNILGANKSTLKQIRIKGGSNKCAEMIDCEVRALDVEGCNITSLDLSRSTIIGANLTMLPIENAVLSKVSFRDCEWPNQIGRSTWYGKFEVSPRLVSHPVSDINGLNAELQNAIAEQQFLSYLAEATKKNVLRKLSFYLWGVFTDYGRSLSRFALFCVFSIAVFSALQTRECGTLITAEGATIVREYLNSFSYKAQIFLGFPVTNSPDGAVCKAAYDFPMRVIGFVGMGIWIGLAANRLGLLSNGSR